MWELSYVNINMLLATIPDYRSEKEKEEDGAMDNTKEVDVDTPEDLKNFLNL